MGEVVYKPSGKIGSFEEKTINPGYNFDLGGVSYKGYSKSNLSPQNFELKPQYLSVFSINNIVQNVIGSSVSISIRKGGSAAFNYDGSMIEGKKFYCKSMTLKWRLVSTTNPDYRDYLYLTDGNNNTDDGPILFKEVYVADPTTKIINFDVPLVFSFYPKFILQIGASSSQTLDVFSANLYGWIE